MRFAIFYIQGPAWVQGKSIYEQPAEDHDKWALDLLEANKLLLAGPFSDDSGGLVVLEVSDEAEAQDLFAHDPGLLSGVFRATLHPWHIVYDKYPQAVRDSVHIS